MIKLDKKPNSWEEKTALFLAYLVEQGIQSSTLRSYVSAIKRTLIDDGYQWNNNLILLSTLTRGCKLINDTIRIRFPIQCGLLELILFEIRRKYDHESQPYLLILFQSLFALGYYGLMRVGELTASNHVVRARNVHLARNKDKLLVILYTSKTHGTESYPQKIRIVANQHDMFKARRNFCPFKLVSEYIDMRGGFDDADEQFFVYSDGSPVTAYQARSLLKQILVNLGLDARFYDMHSLRIGRASDMVKHGTSIEIVKSAG